MQKIRITPSDSIQKVINEASFEDLEIVLSSGEYEEKVFVSKKNVRLIGDGNVKIVFSDHHGTIRDGKVFGTGDSATFTVGAPNFYAEGIEFSNSFDYPYWHSHNLANPEKKVDTQAVAFRTVAGADKTILKNCIFSSWQDTVYPDVGTHLFSNCRISGNVDFIFGAGEALFEYCELVSIGEGFIAAPSTFTNSNIGFVFDSCKLSFIGCALDSVYLARPWHPSGSINRTSMAVFNNCILAEHIKSELWTGMNSRTPQGVERYWLPEESRFSITRESELPKKIHENLDKA